MSRINFMDLDGFLGKKKQCQRGLKKKTIPPPEAYRRFVTVSCASFLLNGTDPSLWEKKPWINPITPGLKIPFCQSCFFSMNQSNYQNPKQESPSVPNCSTNNIGIEFCLAKSVKKNKHRNNVSESGLQCRHHFSPNGCPPEAQIK